MGTFYHVTLYDRMDSIREHGLLTSAPVGQVWSGGRTETLFLTRRLDDAHAWYGATGSLMDARARTRGQSPEACTPIVLRVRARGLRTECDESGCSVAPTSRFTTSNIARNHVDFWNPVARRWTPVRDWDAAQTPVGGALQRSHDYPAFARRGPCEWLLDPGQPGAFAPPLRRRGPTPWPKLRRR